MTTEGESVAVCDGVSKKFCRNLRRSLLYGLGDIAAGFTGRHWPYENLRRHEFFALHDVSLRICRGERVGCMGQNGSGKTTLLRLLAGIFPPDRGTVCVAGRPVSLLAVGAGMHPHMTVAENMYLIGAILGLPRDVIRLRFDEILAFGDLAAFKDAPAAALSYGMFVRFGFSMALAVQADLLLLDEVLSMADAGFRQKCIDALLRKSATCGMMLVSHSADSIRALCTRLIVLEKGMLVFDGGVGDGFAFIEKNAIVVSEQ